MISKLPIQKECVIKEKPRSSGNPIFNAILKQNHLVSVNLVWKYKPQEIYL